MALKPHQFLFVDSGLQEGEKNIKTLEKSFSTFFFHFSHNFIIIYRFIEIYKRLIELIVNRVGITKVKKKCSGVLFVQNVNSLNIRNSLVSHGRFIHILFLFCHCHRKYFLLFIGSYSRLSNAMHFYCEILFFIRFHPFHTQSTDRIKQLENLLSFPFYLFG